jgi:hypothetical protein
MAAKTHYQKWSSLEVQRKEYNKGKYVSKSSVNGLDTAAVILTLELHNH